VCVCVCGDQVGGVSGWNTALTSPGVYPNPDASILNMNRSSYEFPNAMRPSEALPNRDGSYGHRE
jgi:hypothetical protein